MTNKTNEQLQQQINAFWNQRGLAVQTGGTVQQREREHQVWLESLRGLLPPPPADVIDVGTGLGFLALLIAELGHRVTGYDLSQARLDGAEQLAAGVANPPIFSLGDAIAPPAPASSVDVVANRNVLWTLLDPELAFRNWYALLRPGGRVLAVHGVPRDEDPRRGTALFEEHYTDEVLDRLPHLRRLPTLEPAAQWARDTGYLDVEVVHLEQLERHARDEHKSDYTWLALTAVRPE
jgi:SAM-dependent methyltransferase